jgi:hypothetical protein
MWRAVAIVDGKTLVGGKSEGEKILGSGGTAPSLARGGDHRKPVFDRQPAPEAILPHVEDVHRKAMRAEL